MSENETFYCPMCGCINYIEDLEPDCSSCGYRFYDDEESPLFGCEPQ